MLRLRQLQLHRAPGLEGGLRTLEFDAPVVIVVGDNGSGKSTIGRLLRQSLWLEPVPDALDATLWWSDGRVCRAARGRVVWEGEPPRAPPAGATAWTLSLTELLQPYEGASDPIAAAVANALHGGYDLGAVASSASLTDRSERSARRQLEDALEHLHDVRRQQAQLDAHREELSSLEIRLEQAQAAQQALPTHKTALAASELRHELRELDELLAELPGPLLACPADAAERLSALQLPLAAAQQELTDLSEELANLRHLASDSSPTRPLLRAWRQRVDALRDLELACAKLDEELAALGHPSPPTLRDLQELEAAASAHAQAVRKLQAAQDALSEAPLPPPQAPPTQARLAWVVLALSLLALCASLALAAWLPSLAVAAAGLVNAAPALVLAGWQLLRAHQIALERIEAASRQRSAWRAAASARVQAAVDAEAAAKAHRDQAATSVGASPLLGDLPLLAWVSEVRLLQERAQAYTAHRRRATHLRGQLREVQNELSELLDLLPEHTHASSATVALDTLTDRLADAEAIERDRARVSTELRRSQARHAALAQQQGELYEALGLDKPAASLLQERLAQLERVQVLRRRHEVARDTLAEHARHLPESLCGLSPPIARQQLAAAQELAQQVQPLSGEVVSLRARLSATEQGRALSDARARAAQATDALAEARQRVAEDIALRTLCGWLEGQVERTQTPALLLRARQWLLRFSRGRYELSLGDDRALCALDTETGRRLALDALSDGSRVQLLLASRIAWLEHQELPDQPLPLFLDEALATTDPHRLRAIVSALSDLASAGRQIFYATSSPSEALQLQALLAQTGTDATLVHLGAPVLADAPPPAPAPPQTLDLSEWRRRAGCLAPSPQLPASRCGASWLFLDTSSPAVLYHQGIRTVGQLVALHRSGLPLPLDDATLPIALQRAQALERLVQGARRGRSQPVPWELVLASGALSPAFEEPIRALHRQHHRDAQSFVQRVRALPRFRRQSADALEESLAHLLGDGRPLSPAELIEHAIPDHATADDPQLLAWAGPVVQALLTQATS